MIRRSSVLSVVLVIMAGSSAQAQKAKPAEYLSITDKTLWQVPDNVKVGTILKTDPAMWGQKDGVFFSVYSKYLVGKLTTETTPWMDETIVVNKRSDLTAVLPLVGKLLGSLGFSFAKSRNYSFTTSGTTVEQFPAGLTTQIELQVQAAHPTGPEGSELFARLNAVGATAGELSGASQFWIVTKVYRATSLTMTDAKRKNFKVGLGCTANLSTELATGEVKPTTPAASSTPVAAAAKAQTSATPVDAKVSSNVAVATGKPPTATISGSISNAPAPNSTTASGTAKPAVAQVCSLAQAGFSSEQGRTATGSNVIVFVQLKPVFLNRRRGTLYLPSPTSTDSLSAPVVTLRS